MILRAYAAFYERAHLNYNHLRVSLFLFICGFLFTFFTFHASRAEATSANTYRHAKHKSCAWSTDLGKRSHTFAPNTNFQQKEKHRNHYNWATLPTAGRMHGPRVLHEEKIKNKKNKKIKENEKEKAKGLNEASFRSKAQYGP